MGAEDLELMEIEAWSSMMATVDVFVPCYNYGRFLRECVESILTQEGVAVRVLILDDCSTDDSSDVGLALAAADPRVEYRRHRTNLGHIANYNVGLAWAAADYTLLLSADDILPPGALARAAKVFDAHPNVGMVYGRHLMFAQVGDLPREAGTIGEPQCVVTPGEKWLERFCQTGVNHTASGEVIVRTRHLRDVGGYTRELPHTADMELWMRFAARADVGFIDRIQVYYRRHDQCMSSRIADTKVKEAIHYRLAFESFFGRDITLLVEGARLQRLAKEAVARNALDAAYGAFWSGDGRNCRALMKFSLEAFREARTWPLYRRLRKLSWIGPRLSAAIRRAVHPFQSRSLRIG